MIQKPIQSIIAKIGILLVVGCQTAQAQLPALQKEPWLGFYAVHQQRDFQFKIDTKGQGILIPLQKNGEPITQVLHLPLEIFIEEKMPDGKQSLRAVQAVSLTAVEPPAEKLAKATFKGKTVGDAAFEVTVEAQGARLRYGGRITDKGSLTANPIRLIIRTRFPSAYKAGDRDKKEVIKQIKDDELRVARLDGKRFKLSGDKPLAEPPNEVADKDLSSVGVKIGAWRGMAFEFSATAHSAIRLTTAGSDELIRGFHVEWSPDPATDPKGESRLQIEVK